MIDGQTFCSNVMIPLRFESDLRTAIALTDDAISTCDIWAKEANPNWNARINRESFITKRKFGIIALIEIYKFQIKILTKKNLESQMMKSNQMIV